MTVVTATTLALQCPACGKYFFSYLSLFHFADRNKNNLFLNCSCGSFILGITTRDRNTFWFNLYCAVCEGRHISKLQRRDIWNEKLLTLICDETGLEIGYCGDKKQVQNCVKKSRYSLNDLADDMGFHDYFENSDVMHRVLEQLYRLAEENQLYCNCGSHNIDIEIFPQKLELKCEKCHTISLIMANQEADAERLQESRALELLPEHPRAAPRMEAVCKTKKKRDNKSRQNQSD